MRQNRKFKMFLNIILIIATLIALILCGIWAYESYEKYKLEKDSNDIIEDFDAQFDDITVDLDQNIEQTNETGDNKEQQEEGGTQSSVKKTNSKSRKNTRTSSNSPTRKSGKKIYKGYVMDGYIQIPRTKVKLPILEAVSAKALNYGIGILLTPGLNQPGNTVLLGHNYRNGTLFSRNSKIQLGDAIYITDEYGNKVEYIVYNTYVTSPDDGEYMTRDTAGGTEISLSTCTDDGSQRLIIWAKVE